MSNYRLEGKTFVIDDYDRMPAFSSFLPGLAHWNSNVDILH